MRTIASPEPSATPLMAAITGLAHSRIAVEALASPARVRGQVSRPLDDLSASLEIRPGTEHLAGARQHDDAHIV